MSFSLIGILGIVSLVVLLMMGLHIGVSMLLVGFVGFLICTDFKAAFGVLSTVPYSTAENYSLCVIPLFVLMGQLAFYSGLSQDLYSTTYKWLGRLPGGLGVATVGACAGFAAICGSSSATAATMGTVALPEMKKYGYDGALSTGCLAAGGTLGILIPPSVGFILYGVIAEQSIGQLFAAGIIPGLLMAALFSLTIIIMSTRNPKLGPKGVKVSFREKLISLKDIVSIALLFLLVIGGMFLGWFTANEGAAIGAALALLFMILRRRFTFKSLVLALIDTAKTTAMIFMIMIGAYVFGYFLAVTQIPMLLANVVSGLNVSRYVVLVLILIVYIILGCLMDALAMVMLTVPIFMPVISNLGFDLIWFGVIMVMVMEQGAITPPVGMNSYVISGVAKDIPLATVFRGIIPFWFCMMITIVIITLFPDIALFLPKLLYE
jgi:C4-dicarboxylate transporter DctM subunit